ncbi:MAG: hypothetical protein ACJAVA_000304 [Flavobacteriaceae bacterium]|jgi:hypothetical protein
METSKEYKVNFKCARQDYGILTIPKGTKLTHQTAMGIDKDYHFVNEFNWIKPHDSGTPQYGLIMDAKNYGINVPKEYVKF